ncbi:MAG TPA: hypothetical protein PKL60_07610 [Anaerolineaceae bacterium]|nr:hypothetical protein [Anaerolineaceae bacterium]
MKKRLLAVVLLPLLLLTSCNFPSPALPREDQPLYLPPAGQTLPPPPTATPDPFARIKLGTEVVLPLGSLAFSPLASMDESGLPVTLSLGEDKAVMNNAEETLFFSLTSESAGTNPDAAACLASLLARMQPDLPGLSASAAVDAAASGLTGLQTELSGTLLGAPMTGKLAVFQVQSRCISLLGAAAAENSQALWQESGQYAFAALLGSLRVLPPGSVPACLTASDPEYAFSPEKPIRVGNVNLYDGVSRMEAYLNTLRGPNMEEISYIRLNPQFNAEEEVVDAYQINYAGLSSPVILYFSIYSYETPLAPLGFSCEAAFPLRQP